MVGTRPNMVKTAPVIGALRARLPDAGHVIVHTGQHYDDAMSRHLPRGARHAGAPDHLLDVGSGTHAVQTARVMERIEPVCSTREPDLVLVPGDVNSTLAAALTAAKLEHPGRPRRGGPAQLRPHDAGGDSTGSSPTSSPTSSSRTRRRRRRTWRARASRASAIHEVGNTMIDTLVALRPRSTGSTRPGGTDSAPGEYVVVTLHRPALVDGAAPGGRVRGAGRARR